ncbi:RNA polymerase subunit sigma-70 [Xylophilus rhododendri]|uniref:RNA polymerase subunit sigma-70 n=1 Tax=Xylophilus rhododendri TaxID=2697032 RepID=A0A857J279_9BURK|nr:anti-sigma factor [Xylophilus rhododendri]QHI98024.1 RNA polymerase subunit sigma-70 [Xylophilus rhododendri]
MNLLRHPDLLDQIAASYALGTLRGGARRRFEGMARENPGVRSRALLWQETFAAFTELQPGLLPSPQVWQRIENMLPALRRPVAAAAAASATATATDLLQGLRRALGLWRGAALVGGLAAVAAVVVGVRLDQQLGQREVALAQAKEQGTQLTAQLAAQPRIEYVAVLQDDKQAGSVLVTFDPAKRALTLKRVGDYQEGTDKSLELWALPPGQAPRSLGLMGQGAAVARLTAAEGDVAPSPALAITLEPKGGAPAGGGPTGPIVFKGALLKTDT